MNKQLRADLILILVTICWGASFYLVDITLAELDSLTLLAYRFMGAFIIVFLFFFKKALDVNIKTLLYSLYAGIFLAITYFMSVIGVANTSVTNAAFLCAMSVVFTPILSIFFNKIFPNAKFIFVVFLCVVGMALLTLGDNFSIAIGDFYSLCCAFAFAINLIITELALKNEDVKPLQLGIYMLGFVGVIVTILAFIFEKPTLPQTPKIWGAIIFLTIICTAITTILQAIAQKDTSANHVGIIYTLEPIFASIIAYIFAGEVLKLKGYFGAFLMIISILIMEIDFSVILQKNKKIIQ